MWMSQQIMSNLFGVEENTITDHIQELFKSGELDENPITRKIRVVQNEGKRQVNQHHYSLLFTYTADYYSAN